MPSKVIIIDYGSQVTQLIARRVREAGVKIKLNPQPGIFDGKEAVIVDDSLVRGPRP
mgnify:CR=1 FL=1